MSASVDFQTFDLDGQVHDLMWCGYQDETVLMQTSEGTVYRSRDRGLSWKRLAALMTKTAYNIADEDQEVSEVSPRSAAMHTWEAKHPLLCSH